MAFFPKLFKNRLSQPLVPVSNLNTSTTSNSDSVHRTLHSITVAFEQKRFYNEMVQTDNTNTISIGVQTSKFFDFTVQMNY
jgi:hypothetical protein